MSCFLKRAGELWHSVLCKSRSSATIYLRVLCFLRNGLSPKARQRLRNSINTTSWPELNLSPRRVSVGKRTSIILRPHIGEFDFDVLLSDSLDYERELFDFIEDRVTLYDIIIEIGANVGVFTAFIGSAARAVSHPIQLFAFEPSTTAYTRLLDNLELNRLHDVSAFNVAIADRTSFIDFFEPRGHITNGSLIADFARQFSAYIGRRKVIALSGAALTSLLSPGDRLLLKIDVEGAEPLVLASLEAVFRHWAPDVLIEVLQPVADDLNKIEWLRSGGYSLFHLTSEGAIERVRFEPGQTRDYFLTPASRAAGLIRETP